LALKAQKPEVKEKRLKMFVYGVAGVGKTLAALQFPNAYIIDCEKGTDFYADTINKANSVVLQTLDPDEIKEELRQLLTTKHGYKTLIIDPITQVYNATQEKWNKVFGKYAKTQEAKDVQDWGMRYWGKVKGDFKSIQRLILALDMNVIVTAHQKDVYGTGFSKIGVTFDSMKGDDYFFDYVFRIEKKAQGQIRLAISAKERAEIGKNKFPAQFDWSYDNFLKFYGKEILEKESTPVVMASVEQVATIKKLIDVVKIDDAAITKWFNKAKVEDFSEMTGEQITKCVEFVQKKLDSLKNDKPEKAEKKGAKK